MESCLHRYSDQQSASSSIKMAFRQTYGGTEEEVAFEKTKDVSDGTCHGTF